MSLLHPQFLYALAILAIPIIIHLFNFRRFKKVVFPNVRMLRKVDLQTRSKNKLKHLLVLMARLLALTCLVFAFARPFIPAGDDEAEQSNKVAIYLDNSFSMQLENEEGMLLSQAAKTATDIVDAFDRNTRFILLTNDLLPEHQFELSGEEMKDAIASTGISPASRTYSEVVGRAADALGEAGSAKHQLYYISDFQQSGFDPINLRNDTTIQCNLIDLDHMGQGNVYIDSVWFESPIRSIHSPEQMVVRVVNASAKDLYDIPLRLTIEGQQKALGNMSLKAFSTVDSSLTFTNSNRGWVSGQVSINDSPITFDDKLFLSYHVREECKIMILGEGSASTKVARIFSNDPFFSLTTSSLRSMDLGLLKETDLVVLSDLSRIESGTTRELARFVEEGGSLCIIPDVNGDRGSLSELLLAIGGNAISVVKERELKANSLDISSSLYQDVFDRVPQNMDYPTVFKYLQFNSRVRSSEQRLIQLMDGNPLLSAFRSGKGAAYVFASGLQDESSTLASHSLFITSLLRMAELSADESSLYQEIGTGDAFALRIGTAGNEQIYEFRHQVSGPTFIPEQRRSGSETQFYDRGQASQAGSYDIYDGEKRVAEVSYNYSRKESQMEFISSEDISNELDKNGITGYRLIDPSNLQGRSSLSSDISGRPLWRHFIIAGLFFLLVEILLLKFWKP